MGFRNTKHLVDSINNGKSLTAHIRKVPGLASTAGCWADIGMATGNPIPNYYASTPLTAATLSKWEGVFHGDDKSPSEKYIVDIMLCTPTAAMLGPYFLMDYLLYYPFIDLDDTAEQFMVNNVTLPRNTDGAGVRAMLVAQAPTVGGGQFIMTYVNQDGNTRTTPTNYCTTTGMNMGTLLTMQPASAGGLGPFVILAGGDTGVRQIISFTNLVSNGGLGCLVLVQPLATATIREINTAMEVSYPNMRTPPPRVLDGAYLNFICNPAGSIAAGLLAGRINYAWT
jgi:hypothetical protein